MPTSLLHLMTRRSNTARAIIPHLVLDMLGDARLEEFKLFSSREKMSGKVYRKL